MLSLLVAAALATASPAPLPSFPPLPQIYHSISRPLCSSLQNRIKPALGMMIGNDRMIAAGVGLFDQYIMRATEGSDAGRDIAVMHLESLVTPLANNELAIQKLLDDPAVFPPGARNDDDRRLIRIKTEMLKTLAAQSAALDIINGFVTTQQLSEMQHQGFGYVSAITSQSASPPPDHPQTFDDVTLQAGLAPNQYEIDPSTIPGLALGYNPISNLKKGVEWTQSVAHKEEIPLAQTIVDAAHSCGAPSQPAASPSPTP